MACPANCGNTPAHDDQRHTRRSRHHPLYMVPRRKDSLPEPDPPRPCLIALGRRALSVNQRRRNSIARLMTDCSGPSPLLAHHDASPPEGPPHVRPMHLNDAHRSSHPTSPSPGDRPSIERIAGILRTVTRRLTREVGPRRPSVDAAHHPAHSLHNGQAVNRPPSSRDVHFNTLSLTRFL